MSFVIGQIDFVSDKDDVVCRFLGRVMYEARDLVRDGGERLGARHVVDGDAPVGVSVVGLGHRAEPLLACCIPHLHFHDFVVD